MSKSLGYEITHIAIKHLSVVWRKSQRQYDEKWAKEIADNFDPDKFEPVAVTKPNGQGMFHIVEGQHRTGAAAIYLGDLDQKIPCHIVGEADPARAAEIFLGINKGRKNVRPVVEFLVAVEARREVEVACNSIVKRAGYTVSENSKGQNCLMAVTAIRKVYQSYGGTILLRTLETCRLLWEGEPDGVRGPMILGVGMFVNEFQHHIDPLQLKKAITNQYKSPWKFLEACKFAAEKSSERKDVATSELLRIKYNHGLREEKKLRRKEKN